ncbi:unnamed protein product [Cylicocyclus nassatus]|uniref:Uncharacterized protein n=1 Tax=Cylicocyclus nassatus TaxID=53992 RepID=A0AA36H2F3_CYLNA|nr:unnamed protein product [Cylicocyclus nassatus]
MMRLFRTTDTTKHCGVNTKIACIVLGILVTAMEIYTYIFLPIIPGLILCGIATFLFFVLLVACVKMLPSLLVVFMILNMLMKIPILVVVYFITYTLASYGGYYLFCNDYQCSLYHLSTGLLWSGLIVAFISCILDGVLTAGVRKLRLLSQGVRSVMLAQETHHHCHPRTVVVASAPQPIVYTTTAAGAGYSAAVVYSNSAPPGQQYVYSAQHYSGAQPYPNLQAPTIPQSVNPSAPQTPSEYKP